VIKSTSAREEILTSIRNSLPSLPIDPSTALTQIQRTYIRHSELSREAILELFVDRLIDYETEIFQTANEDGIAEAVAQALQRNTENRILAPPEFPADWLPGSVDIVRDKQLTTAQLDAEAVVITTCRVAVAATGTILLVHGGNEGRRAITLLPDHHICLVRRDQVCATVTEALVAVASDSRKPITTISGPSATSDIEMTRVRGVHGPRRLTVILYGA
jgi:L-lactate dehydrogenase complex protein LldG